MKTFFIVVLCAIGIQFQAEAQWTRQRLSADQPPDLMAQQGLEQAMAAYQDLETQQRQLEVQEAALQQQKQAEQAARQQAIQDKLKQLKQEASQAAQDAEAAEIAVQQLTKGILQEKEFIPIDPWREINGVKEYVKSAGTDFLKFNGQILQIKTDGLLIAGICGTDNTNFFVKQFPKGYHFTAGDNLSSGTGIYVAVSDGNFTYMAIDGSIRCVPQLNYGKPCSRPPYADAIENEAQKLTPQEQQQINDAKDNAKSKMDEAQTAASTFQIFVREIEEEKNAEIRAKNAPQAKALEFDQKQADKGDTYGLLRMGERYRDGDGVTKDLEKAGQYLSKAANAGSLTAEQELKSLSQPSHLSPISTPK